MSRLSAIKERVGESVSYGHLKLIIAILKRNFGSSTQTVAKPSRNTKNNFHTGMQQSQQRNSQSQSSSQNDDVIMMQSQVSQAGVKRQVDCAEVPPMKKQKTSEKLKKNKLFSR